MIDPIIENAAALLTGVGGAEAVRGLMAAGTWAAREGQHEREVEVRERFRLVASQLPTQPWKEPDLFTRIG